MVSRVRVLFMIKIWNFNLNLSVGDVPRNKYAE